MGPRSKPTAPRVLAALVSFGLVLGGGLLLRGGLGGRGSQPTVRIVERDGPNLNDRFRERAREGRLPASPGRVMEPVTLETARLLVPSLRTKSLVRYDPIAIFENRPNERRQRELDEHPSGFLRRATNNLGFREYDDVDPAADPDLRILVTGDSHTDGVVPNEESFTNVLEAMLVQSRGDRAVEALNAGCGGYCFFNYLGVLKKHLALDPDVFVVAVFGGNDFAGSVFFHRWFRRLPPGPGDTEFNRAQKHASRRYTSAYAQSLNQVLRFRRFPGELELGLDAARDVTREIRRLCDANDVRLVCAYIPSPAEVSLASARPDFERVCELFDEDPDVRADARLPGDRYLAFLAEEGIPVADLRDAFEASDEPVYWESDHHINTLGHRLVAEALLPLVE